MSPSGGAVRTAGLGASLTAGVLRAVWASLLLVVVVVVTFAAVPTDGPTDVPLRQGHHDRRPVWLDSYSRRFPGCVSLVLWPAARRPVAYVARTSHGRLSRIDAGRAAAPPSARAIGACRRAK